MTTERVKHDLIRERTKACDPSQYSQGRLGLPIDIGQSPTYTQASDRQAGPADLWCRIGRSVQTWRILRSGVPCRIMSTQGQSL